MPFEKKSYISELGAANGLLRFKRKVLFSAFDGIYRDSDRIRSLPDFF